MSSRPVLDQLNIVVNDMEASATFYRRLGLEIEPGPPERSPHHRPLALGREGIDLDLDSGVFARQRDRGWPAGRLATPSSKIPTGMPSG